jgi:NADH-quinone oxidoreductase subunit J
VTAETLLFYAVAAFAVTTAVLMVIQRNPLMSAIFLIGNFFALATMYLLLHAQLLAILQILVYAGAIMVLVVFVIMLLNLGDERVRTERVSLAGLVGIAAAVGLVLELLFIVTGFGENPEPAPGPADPSIGTVEGMGDALFRQFLLPFEITSFLLLAAILGAVVLAKKRLEST